MRTLVLTLALAMGACGGAAHQGPPVPEHDAAAAMRWLVTQASAQAGSNSFLQLTVVAGKETSASGTVLDAKGAAHGVWAARVDRTLVMTAAKGDTSGPVTTVGAAELSALENAAKACPLKVDGEIREIELLPSKDRTDYWRLSSTSGMSCLASLQGEIVTTWKTGEAVAIP